MTDLPTKYANETNEHIKFLITGEAIEMDLTPENKQSDFYNERFGPDVLKNDEGMSRSATVDFIGKTQISEKNVEILYSHILNGNAILISGEDTRNMDLLLKRIPSVPDTEYKKLSTDLGQLMHEWTKNVKDQKTRIENHLETFKKETGFDIITKLGVPVEGIDVQKLKDEIKELKNEINKLKETKKKEEKEYENSREKFLSSLRKSEDIDPKIRLKIKKLFEDNDL